MKTSKEKNFEKALPAGYTQALYINAKSAKFGIIFNLIAFAVFGVVLALAFLSLLLDGRLTSDNFKMEPLQLLLAYLVFVGAMVGYIVLHDHFLRSLELIPNDEMEYLFKKAARVGCAIELNQSDMTFAEEEKDIILRPFRIAKKCGCKFYLGSDAHHPDKFKKSLEVFGNAVDLLGLTEDDKFHIKRV